MTKDPMNDDHYTGNDEQIADLKELVDKLLGATIIVTLEGGLVSHVCTDTKELLGLDVQVIDYDTEGADEDELGTVFQDDGEEVEAFVRHETLELSTISATTRETELLLDIVKFALQNKEA